MGKANKTTPRARALQLNVEGLLKLLGGTPDERLRFWEILKGITTPAEFQLVRGQLQSMQKSIDQVQADTAALVKAASKIERNQ
jgi:hypothetical protein